MAGGVGEIPFASFLRGRSDLFVALGIVSIVVMMVVPVPALLLDLLLALNITVAIVILLISMYTKNTLEFSIFPSVLLVSTLFRLALNISTTRLILLLGGDLDSKIIRAFGEFVVGGNYVVGVVIFLILMIIQFIVITKGAGRVAEVAARFTLDGMPGKQMSIDADFNAGVITEDEARTRRRNLQREADFYGAMDGASKFVQGDAIAGIVITFINILGGLVIGVWQKGYGIGESASIYVLLTVGDGLVAQIPALLISTATGLVVTRAASDSNLGTNMAEQFLAQPKALGIASGVLFGMGAVPGLPTFAFWTLSLVAGVAAWAVGKTKEEEARTAATQKQEKEKVKAQKPEDVAKLMITDPMELEIGYSLIPLVSQEQGGSLLERIQMIRRQMMLELGLIVPQIRIRDNMQLKPDVYVVKIKGQEVAQGQLLANHYLAMNPGTAIRDIQGIDTVEPAFGLPAVWITELQREEAEMAGYTVADISSVVATHLTEIVKRHAAEILGRQETQTIVNTLRESYPDLVAELIPGVIKLGDFQKVLQNLLREGVSIRNMTTVLEVIADVGPDASGDADYISERIREGLKRQITKSFTQADGTLSVTTLDPDLEDRLAKMTEKGDRGAYLAVPGDVAQRVWQAAGEEVKKMNAHGVPPVVLVSAGLRLPFRRFLEKVVPMMAVMSYNEVGEGVRVNAVGVIQA